jgi:hypothetical protein
MSRVHDAKQAKAPEVDERELYEMRLEVLGELLVHGASRRDVIEFAMNRFGVCRRTAELCLQTIRRRLANDATEEDHLFCLKLSQIQRDRMIHLAIRHINAEEPNPQLMQALASLTTAVRGLLDSRDRTAGEIHSLVQERLAKAAALEEQPKERHEPSRSSSSCENGHTTGSDMAPPTARQASEKPATHQKDEPPTFHPHQVANRLNPVRPTPPSSNGPGDTATSGADRYNSMGKKPLERSAKPPMKSASACASCATGPTTPREPVAACA